MRKITLILLAALLLTGCGIRPYTVDIQQGNVIDREAVAKLRLGMNKSEVNALLGSPVLQDVFSKNTWTYAYTNQIDGGKIEKKSLVLEFKRNKLVQIK